MIGALAGALAATMLLAQEQQAPPAGAGRGRGGRGAAPGAPANPSDGPPRTVTVLGCTGSVGTQTIDLLLGATRGRFQVRVLVAGRTVDWICSQR